VKPLFHAILIALAIAFPATADETTFTLAQELLTEEQYPLAGVEFRRMALETTDPQEQSAAYLYAGYSYLNAGQPEFTGEMLDRAEAADQASEYTGAIALLSAENAFSVRDLDSALYYYDLLANDTAAGDSRAFALRRAATVHLLQRDPEAARRRLVQLGAGSSLSIQALEEYAAGKDKKPMVGGLLGIIPGAGYWYSGEIANGFRSLILNSLFIYGMVDTARDDQWGAFAIITFFELTWYSGSIYGGVDAAHRYNQERLDQAIQGIERDMSYAPESGITLPIFKLNFEF